MTDEVDLYEYKEKQFFAQNIVSIHNADMPKLDRRE